VLAKKKKAETDACDGEQKGRNKLRELEPIDKEIEECRAVLKELADESLGTQVLATFAGLIVEPIESLQKGEGAVAALKSAGSVFSMRKNCIAYWEQRKNTLMEREKALQRSCVAHQDEAIKLREAARSWGEDAKQIEQELQNANAILQERKEDLSLSLAKLQRPRADAQKLMKVRPHVTLAPRRPPLLHHSSPTFVRSVIMPNAPVPLQYVAYTPPQRSQAGAAVLGGPAGSAAPHFFRR
jgi:hypothetical protein